jgi:hypothetical protein
MDGPMKDEMAQVPKPYPFRYITRRSDEMGVEWLVVDGEDVTPLSYVNNCFYNNSGVLGAAWLAQFLKVDRLYLFGVDFFRQTPDGKNDLYSKNTLFSNKFVHCWNLIAHLNPWTKVTRVGAIADEDREFYDKSIKGIELISYPEFFATYPSR